MLEHIDIKILKYICKNEPVHMEDILKKFPDKKFSTNFRLQNLKTGKYTSSGRFLIENTSYIIEEYDFIKGDAIPLNTYVSTELGKKFLQDSKIEDVKNTKEYFKKLIIEIMRSILFPLLVALVTAYLTTKYLK